MERREVPRFRGVLYCCDGLANIDGGGHLLFSDFVGSFGLIFCEVVELSKVVNEVEE